MTRLRPGHADLAGTVKYDFDDVRPVLERASARETAARVAVGAVCKRLLDEFGVAFHSHTVQIGAVEALVPQDIDWDAVEESPVRCADAAGAEKMIAAIDEARNAGDTLGGVVEGRVLDVPIGLGSHVHWDRKIDGQLAQALMSIHSVKGVEIGARVRRDPADRLAGPRCDPAARALDGPRLGARDEQCRRHRGRHHERAGRRRPHRAEADRDAPTLAPLGRPR